MMSLQATFILIAALITAYYILIPLLAYFQNRVLPQPTVELVDWNNSPLPPAFRERVERDGEQLQSLGFQRSVAYSVDIMQGKTETVSFLFWHPELHVSAGVTATLIGMQNGFILSDMFTVLAVAYKLADEPRLQVSNQDTVINLGLRIQDETCPFPHVKRVERLLMLLDRLEQRHFSGSHRLPIEHGRTDLDHAAFLAEKYGDIIESWIENGTLERIPNDSNYRYPLSTMYQACWGKWLPFGPILKLFRHIRSRQMERELLNTTAG